MIGGIPFLVGLLGIIVFVAVRVSEVKRGIRLFGGARKKLDALVTSGYQLVVFGEIPTGYRVWMSHTLHTMGHVVVSRAARALRSIERSLSSASRKMIARRPHIASGKGPSHYLKNISPKESVGKNTKDSV